MTDHAPVLSVRRLSKRIGDREIVKDVSFEVQRGEIFGFLGPNGAGKTTTIRMLVGLIRPTSGEIRIGGYDLSREFLKAIRHVGCIVENPELYPYLTGYENLELFSRMAEDIPRSRIDEVVERVELTERIHEPVKTYSLGMRQRLGIAQALLAEPRLLILDEPTNGLDPAGIRELRTFIRRLSREEGISVFISSHILHEVQLMCDRVAIIHDGTVVHTGRVDELLTGKERVQWLLHPAEKGADLLRLQAFVSRVDMKDDRTVIAHMPPEKAADANRMLLDEGIRVEAIRPLTPTLEDIFLELTGGVHVD
ncbi:ABC transporter ATP-binding protein [Staphylospora marina]|uniref:ABC transporter ATP-binding protein n=1 Tax=Staphylospora marina TaxID=2490858 RepID=UPI001F153C11|nr:ABC transporter ATP-binding protein [Staphylospora marina]